MTDLKHCIGCHQNLPIERFRPMEDTSDLSPYCGTCIEDREAVDFLAWLAKHPSTPDGDILDGDGVERLSWIAEWISLRLGVPDRREFWHKKFEESEKISRRFDAFHPEPYWNHWPFKNELTNFKNLPGDFEQREGLEWWDKWIAEHPVDSWTTQEIEEGWLPAEAVEESA